MSQTAPADHARKPAEMAGFRGYTLLEGMQPPRALRDTTDPLCTDRERLVAGHRVHRGAEGSDVVPHLHEELALRNPGHVRPVTAHQGR